MELSKPSAARLAARHKPRRLIFQLDALGHPALHGMEPEHYRDLIFGYVDRGDAKVDSIFWDFMYSGDFYAMYESSILPRRTMKAFEGWWSRGFDMMGELTRGAKARGIENILVHRISEVDIGLSELDYAEKRRHPEWQLDGSWYAGHLKRQGEGGLDLLNLAHPEVRDRKVKILSELLEKYDWDGLEIDLCRHTPFLPRGREWENRGALTDLMCRLRGVLDRLEEKNGHPYLLSVRTGETPDICRHDGVDLETWLESGILDSVTAGGRSFSPDVEGMRALIDRYGGGQKLYATLDYHHATDGYALPPMEVWRGVCAAWDARGVDGIKLFNWWTAPEDLRLKTARECRAPSLADFAPNHGDEAVREFSDRAAVLTGDRTFVAERRGGYPWANGWSNTNAHAPLPLDVNGTAEVKLFAAGEFSGRRAELTVLVSEAEGAAVSVLLDGRELTLLGSETGILDNTIPPRGVDRESGYRPDRITGTVNVRRLTWEADAAQLKTGFLTVTVTSDRPIRLEKAELHVTKV